MTPKINYKLLGEAVDFYEQRGYRYVEVPWLVSEYTIRATLPEPIDFLQVGTASHHMDDSGRREMLLPYYRDDNALVGSAEQGFITMSLAPGRYVGVTPCFRTEKVHDLFYQDTFMKVELFDNRSDAQQSQLRNDAWAFFTMHADPDELARVDLDDGTTDIMLGGVEIGSYGVREDPHFGRWAYGTGLALPRFGVAEALSKVV